MSIKVTEYVLGCFSDTDLIVSLQLDYKLEVKHIILCRCADTVLKWRKINKILNCGCLYDMYSQYFLLAK